jgi:hypothetical protein
MARSAPREFFPRFFQALEKIALTFSKPWKNQPFTFPMLGNRAGS